MFPAAVRHLATFAILAASSEVRKSTRGQQRPLNGLAGLPWVPETQNGGIAGFVLVVRTGIVRKC
jgi:hypothetical protein